MQLFHYHTKILRKSPISLLNFLILFVLIFYIDIFLKFILKQIKHEKSNKRVLLSVE